MERIVSKFSSHEEAEEADRRYYLSLTPAERLDILLELISRQRDPNDPSSERLERVYRITELSSG